jgi:hypothetical protein
LVRWGLDEVATEEGRDLLQPRKTADGALYYMRKPEESGIRRQSLLSSLADTALFAFRMGRGGYQYFYVFPMMYTGKPLDTGKKRSAGGGDPRQMFIYGNLAQRQEDESEGLAPASWELVRRDPSGETEVIAKKVLAFDLVGDGGLLYSDGASITRVDARGALSGFYAAS